MGRIFGLCAVLAMTCLGQPASAGLVPPVADLCYGCGIDTIYGLTTLMAYLEANPDVDDAFKGPIITAARAKIARLRVLAPPRPVSPTPCCYTRKPIYIR